MSIKTINEKFRKEGLPLELVKGEGYLYFIYDDWAANKLYDTKSVMVCYFNQLPEARWLEAGRAFATEVRKV